MKIVITIQVAIGADYHNIHDFQNLLPNCASSFGAHQMLPYVTHFREMCRGGVGFLREMFSCILPQDTFL